MQIRARLRLAGIVGVGALSAISVMGTALISGTASQAGAVTAAAPVTALTLTNNDTGDFKAANIQQNTWANENISKPDTGIAAGWQFSLSDNWKAGDKIDITLAPSSGADCNTPQPQGVNQSLDDPSNYVGFTDFKNPQNHNSSVGPAIYDVTNGETPPIIDENEIGKIDCGDQGATSSDIGLAFNSPPHATFSTLELTFGNNGDNDGSSITINVGAGIGVTIGTLLAGEIDVPVLLNTGFGAATGAVNATGAYIPAGFTPTPATPAPVITVASSATITGETPAANVPPTGLVRDTQTDAVSGAISNFTITENVPNSLPPTNDTQNINAPVVPNPAPVNTFDNMQNASVPGDVCLVIDNHDGSDIGWGDVSASAWSVSPGASTSSFSAQAGKASVIVDPHNSSNTILQLPVTNTSNTAPTTWTATGLNLTGTANADGPVWAYVYYVNNHLVNSRTNGCAQISPTTFDDGEPGGSADGFADASDYGGDYQLGYVQLTTVSELAKSIFGADADATSDQAVLHQFDPNLNECVTNQFPQFHYGPSIFLARDDDYHDALGADYAAGSIDSGVLLTSPTSLNIETLDAIREEGVSTVFVAGGSLAIPDSIVTQLENTPSYFCGGTAVRVDGSNKLEDLNVIRVFGATANDTDEQMAEFIGAEPIDQSIPFAEYGTTNPFNDTTGENSTTFAPTSSTNTAILVTDSTWQDAVDASVPGYNDQLPVIITDTASLSPQAQNTIYNDHIGQVLVVGGPLAVSDNVMNQLNAEGIGAVRVAGSDASDTSVQLASFELSNAEGLPAPGDTSLADVGFFNEDQNWLHYVHRTAGVTDTATQPDVAAHVVLLARGDNYADALSAAVLSVHNGRFARFANDGVQFPLVLTESITSVGTPVTTFLNNAGLAISALAGEVPAGGLFDHFESGDQNNTPSSSVYTIQPVGGPLALPPATLSAALAAVTAK